MIPFLTFITSTLWILSKGVFLLPLSIVSFDFLNSVTNSSLLNILQDLGLGSISLLGHCICYSLLLKGYHLILISIYYSDFNTLGHLSLSRWASLPHVIGHLGLSFTIALIIYCRGSQSGAPPVASLPPGNLLEIQILRPLDSSTE